MNWISVNERLPESSKWPDIKAFQVWDGCNQYVAWVDDDGEWTYSDCCRCKCKPTHWMPLPDQPKE